MNHRHQGLFVAACIAFVAAEGGTPLAHAEQRGAVDEQLAKFVIAGLKSNRESLRSGVFTANGFLVQGVPSMDDITGEVQIYCAFDFDRGLFRFERKEPQRKIVEVDAAFLKRMEENALRPEEIAQLRTRSAAQGQHYVTAKYIETPKSTVHWRSGSPRMVSVHGTDKRALGIQNTKAFDVRNLGLAMSLNLENLTPYEKLIAAYDKYSIVEARMVSDTQRLISWVFGPDQTLKITLLIDVTQGFSPVRLEFSERDNDGKWGQPNLWNDLTWIRVSGVWVPKTHSFENRNGLPRLDSSKLDFTWESVNEKLPDKMFSAEGLEESKESFVMDVRLGVDKAITVSRPQELQAIIDSHPKEIRTVPRSLWRSYWLWSGVGLVFGGGVLWWFRFRNGR